MQKTIAHAFHCLPIISIISKTHCVFAWFWYNSDKSTQPVRSQFSSTDNSLRRLDLDRNKALPIDIHHVTWSAGFLVAVYQKHIMPERKKSTTIFELDNANRKSHFKVLNFLPTKRVKNITKTTKVKKITEVLAVENSEDKCSL